MQDLYVQIKDCRKCPLGESRKNAVPGAGPFNAKIMFVGEAPGRNEDEQGLPFVGRAGKILDDLLAIAGLKRDEVYIANILKCRPPGNRNPTTSEIETCTPYLDKQLEIIKPQIICTLGNFSTKYILEKFGLSNDLEPISKIHGKIFSVNTLLVNAKIIPLFHPAAAIYNQGLIESLKKDFETIKNII